MEIHPLLTKYAVTGQEKLHPLMFKREWWQHVENYILCLVNNSDNIWKTMFCLLSAHWQQTVNQIHFFWEKAVTTCRKAYPLLCQTAVTTFMEIHPLLTTYAVTWQQEKNDIHWFLKESSGSTWKSIQYPLFFDIYCFAKQQWQHLWKLINCLANMQWQQ